MNQDFNFLYPKSVRSFIVMMENSLQLPAMLY